MVEAVLCSVKIKKAQEKKKRACAWWGNSYGNAEQSLFLHFKSSTAASPSFTLGVQLESRHDKDASANDCKLSSLFVINSEQEDTRGMKEKV